MDFKNLHWYDYLALSLLGIICMLNIISGAIRITDIAPRGTSVLAMNKFWDLSAIFMCITVGLYFFFYYFNETLLQKKMEFREFVSGISITILATIFGAGIGYLSGWIINLVFSGLGMVFGALFKALFLK